MKSIRRPLLSCFALGVGFLTPSLALAVPDAENNQVVVQPDGAFTAYKNARFYLDTNPEDPFPANGFNTFVYTVQNDCASPLPLIGFKVGIPGPAAVSALPASAGPGTAPDGPGQIAGAEVNWTFFNTPVQPCDTSQGLYIETTYTPGVAVHTIISVNGEAGFDASTVCMGPVVPPAECDLEVDKTCCVPRQPMPGMDRCDGDVEEIEFEYTGDDCSRSNNHQEGRHHCSGKCSDGPVSVSGEGWNGGNLHFSKSSNIAKGERFTITHNNVGFDADSSFEAHSGDGKKQHIRMRTWCRDDGPSTQSLRCGDRFGSMKVVSFKSHNGGHVDCDEPDDDDESLQCVSANAPPGDDCEETPEEIEFEYTGENCQVPLPNPQSGKATCNGSPNGASSVRVTYSGYDQSKVKVRPTSGIQVGGTFKLTAVGRRNLRPDSSFIVSDSGGVRQNVKIRTKCDEALRLGDRFGSLKVVGLSTKSRGHRKMGNAPVFKQACEVPAVPPTPHCTSSIEELQLAYVGNFFGNGCTAINNQSGYATCTGVADPGNPVTLSMTTSGVTAAPTSGIDVPEVVTVTPNYGTLGINIQFTVTGPNGSQTIKIRTDCDKTLNVGDVFGSIAVVGMDRGDGDNDTDDDDDGFVGLGAPVQYQYKVTNPNASTATNISVTDDLFGPIASGITLAPGASTSVYTTKTIYATLTNTATVTGNVGTGQCNEAHDSVVTTVTTPPQAAFVCTAAKPLNTLTFIWNGTQNVKVLAWKGSVGGTLLANLDNIAPGTEASVAGYSSSSGGDVVWELFNAGTTTKIGESLFNLSCYDNEMNGLEDCSKLEGNGKYDTAGKINDWKLEGLRGNGKTLDCSPAPVGAPGAGFCGIGFELAFLLPPIMWLHRRRRQRQ